MKFSLTQKNAKKCFLIIKMSFVSVGIVLPESGEETSWTAIDREEYVSDMKMDRKAAETQLEADAPRIDLQIREKDSSSVRVRDGRIFHQLLREVVSDDVCDGAIACCTQTVMAHPLCALHRVLPDDWIVMNSKHPLRVRVQLLSGRRIKVRTSKRLSVVRQDGLNRFTNMRDIRIVVEYDSGAESVFVGIA